MENITIYILTHKKITEPYDEDLYQPLLNGSALLDEDFGYIQDNSGDNISKLNPYYAELTGQYWVWKNSNADIIGFCHYRRYLCKGLRLQKITKENIINDLKKHDIILPRATKLDRNNKENIYWGMKEHPHYGATCEDYVKLNNLLKNEFPEYYPSFKKVLNKKTVYNHNMFICNKELANTYFSWIFEVFEKLMPLIDFSSYLYEKKVFGFMGEVLLTTFIEKNNLKVKEYYLYHTEHKLPFVVVFTSRFLFIEKIGRKLLNTYKKIKK